MRTGQTGETGTPAKRADGWGAYARPRRRGVHARPNARRCRALGRARRAQKIDFPLELHAAPTFPASVAQYCAALLCKLSLLRYIMGGFYTLADEGEELARILHYEPNVPSW